jgi:D-glycero-D-manno-heptose 1,7-bisphosphate phosphatase
MRIRSLVLWLLIPPDLKIVSRTRSSVPAKGSIFLDLDGTLWPDSGPGSILKESFPPIEIKLCLLKLSEAGYKIIAYSNQTLFGYPESVSMKNILKYRKKMNALIKEGWFDGVFICHHHPKSTIPFLNSNCNRRKPAGGLVEWAKYEFGLYADDCFAIGDRITDIIAAQSAGIRRTFLISNTRSFEWNVFENLRIAPSVCFMVSKDIQEALQEIHRVISREY